MNGLVTDIQRFSLHDGPGIRTTVFCKGCNMRCAWCHNPETINRRPQLQFFESRCIQCGNCKEDCDTASASAEDVFTDSTGKRRHYRGNCQARALVKVGRRLSAEDVLREAEQDRAFYDRSGGGVTLSGGEASLQHGFVRETLTLLRERGIHTAIETNLTAPRDQLKYLLPELDLVIFDIKCIDAALHREWTGVGNERILDNAHWLAGQGKPFIVRTPIIPGFNDDEASIGAVADFIKDFANLSYYELLAFNPLGADKYRCLGMNYRLKDAPLISREKLQCLADVAGQRGIEVRTA